MLMDFLSRVNWVDILLVVILGRAVFIGFKTGFVVEFFKCVGLLFAVFFSLHYYSRITEFLTPLMSAIEPTAVSIFVFLSLWLLMTVLFKFIRDGINMLFSVKPHAYIEKWVAVVIAVVRGLIVCSMTFYVLLLSLNPGVLKLAEKSYSRWIVGHLATNIYSAIYEGVVVKFLPLEPVNQETAAVLRLIERKKK